MANLGLPRHLTKFGERLLWAIENDPRFGTQKSFSDFSGISPSQVSQLVGRPDQPGKKLLAKLSEMLNIPEVWLAYGVDPKGPGGESEGQPTAGLLTILDRESRVAETRAKLADSYIEVAKLAEMAALERAMAAKEWAVAARLEAENVRDLRRELSSSDPIAKEIGDQLVAASDSLLKEERERGTASPGLAPRPPHFPLHDRPQTDE